ncbi:MAG TPA: GNAT family N-acetyltransferase [Rhabdochlamydiaceae bacterium]
MQFKFIRTKDPEYGKELMIRWEVLFKPLGKPPGAEVLPNEDKSLHYVALDKKTVVGCVLFCPDEQSRGFLHQMAVSEEYQGRGFGRKLLTSFEQALAGKGVSEILLQTPVEKVGFYHRMGYHPSGSSTEKFGTFYQLMTKTL